jgi:hypothetical protein
MSFGSSPPPAQTVYVPVSTPAPAQAAPAPPPNPPLFGAQQSKIKGQQSPTQSFSGSVLGALPSGQPTRTLLGTTSQ